MKKTCVLFAAVLLVLGSIAVADEKTIIDFTQLTADIIPDNDGNSTQNRRTAMDYSMSAPASFTPEQRALLRTSLALPEWEVNFNSSARSDQALALSRVASVPVRAESRVSFAGQNIMGVRIIFPTSAANAHAQIVPSFEIPAYEAYVEADENGNRQAATPGATGPDGESKLFEGGYGLVRNVGPIKKLMVTAYGNAYPYALYVLLKDQDDVTRRYFMGSLRFDGWKEMIWENPHYLTDVRVRNIESRPLYPQMELPYVKFVGFEVVRDPMRNGGDFISYFKDVKIIFDKAQAESLRDIAEEDGWGSIEAREKQLQTKEMSRFGAKQVARFAENERVAPEENFTSSIAPAEGAQAAPAAAQ
jgi:hypothetical protein